MRRILAAIRAALARVRWFWVTAADGLGLVMHQVFDTTAAVFAVGDGELVQTASPVATIPQPVARCEAIRQLAIAMAAGTETDHDFRTVSDADGIWLSVLSRQNLCRIACAKDDTLADHFSGKRVMRGVCAADAQSVALLQMALAQEQIEDSLEMVQTIREQRYSCA